MITGHVSVESMGAAHTTTDYAEGSTFASLPAEDARAVNLLRKSGVKFEKVDLSGSLKAKVVARIRGVAGTPTLLVQDNRLRRYEGVRGNLSIH